jgi:hypothetical protein
MRDNRCFICKYCQDNRLKTNDDLIYDAKGRTVKLPLCWGHSVELFKFGQKSFLERHRHIFNGAYGTERDKEIVNYFSDHKKSGAWF